MAIFKEELTKESFKKMWIDYISDMFMDDSIEYRNELSRIYDESFNENDIRIYNNYRISYKMVGAFKFLNVLSEKFMMCENGCLYYRHDIKKSIIPTILRSFMKIRGVYKKQMSLYYAVGDFINGAIFALKQLNTKLIINKFYGLSLFKLFSGFLTDNGSSTTTRGRILASLCVLTAELLGGSYRPYNIDANLRLIKLTGDEVKNNPKLPYTIPNVTVDQVLEQMLGKNKDKYYFITALTSILNKQPQEVLNRLYMKNNIREFLKIPEIIKLQKDIIYKMHDDYSKALEENKDEKDELEFIKKTDSKLLLSIRSIPSGIKDLMSQYHKAIEDLVCGFTYYEGDYIDGYYKDDTIDIAHSIERERITIVDTDSACPMTEVDLNRMKVNIPIPRDSVSWEIVDDHSTPVLIEYIYSTATDKVLNSYLKKTNMMDEYIKLIDFECEYTIARYHLSKVKKAYLFVPRNNEGFRVNYDKVVVKGLAYTKSDHNPRMSAISKDIIDNMIMLPDNAVSIKEVFNKIDNSILDLKSMYENESSVLKMADNGKLNSPIENFEMTDHRRKAVDLYNTCFPKTPIEVPGTFYTLPITLTQDIIDRIRDTDEEMYQRILNLTDRINQYNHCRTLVSNMIKIRDKIEEGEWDENVSLDSKIKLKHGYNFEDVQTYCINFITTFKGKDYTYELFDKMRNDIASSGFATIIEDLIKTDLKSVDDKLIIKYFTKIALPIDNTDLPGLIKHNNFEIVDKSNIAKLGTLIGPVYSGLSMLTIRNGDNQLLCTNIINSY
ncbi:MAG: family B DNA polymerase [Paraclostridium sp.]